MPSFAAVAVDCSFRHSRWPVAQPTRSSRKTAASAAGLETRLGVRQDDDRTRRGIECSRLRSGLPAALEVQGADPGFAPRQLADALGGPIPRAVDRDDDLPDVGSASLLVE